MQIEIKKTLKGQKKTFKVMILMLCYSSGYNVVILSFQEQCKNIGATL